MSSAAGGPLRTQLQRQQAAMSQFGAVALLKASFLKGALTLDAFKEQLAAQVCWAACLLCLPALSPPRHADPRLTRS
jgi:hypothetical protein